MIDERTRELINAAVDGDLGQAELERVQRILEESEEASRYHAELSRLAGLLQSLPDQELPHGLHARIVQATPLPALARRVFRFADLPGVLRYGFAAAAGLLLAVTLYEGGQDWNNSNDASRMVGTIANLQSGAGGEVIDQLSFAEAGASGQVSLTRREGQLVLDLSADSSAPLRFRIDLANSGLQVNGLANPSRTLELQSGDGRNELQGEIEGRQQMVLLLKEAGGSPHGTQGRIDIQFFSGDQLVKAGSLGLDG